LDFMKLGLLISALLVAILMMLMLKPWTREAGRPPAVGNAEGRARFMKACDPVFAAMQKPEAYCACLWEKGVTNPTETLTSPAGQSAVSQCASAGGLAPSSPATGP
jgi:hypothetical protein